MSYLKIIKGKIEQRLSLKKDRIKNDAKNKAKKNIERGINVGCFTFFISLTVLILSIPISIADEISVLGHTIFLYVGIISLLQRQTALQVQCLVKIWQYKGNR